MDKPRIKFRFVRQWNKFHCYNIKSRRCPLSFLSVPFVNGLKSVVTICAEPTALFSFFFVLLRVETRSYKIKPRLRLCFL